LHKEAGTGNRTVIRHEPGVQEHVSVDCDEIVALRASEANIPQAREAEALIGLLEMLQIRDPVRKPRDHRSGFR
jgi:hypothetical protein